jgi:hypothetical protein
VDTEREVPKEVLVRPDLRFAGGGDASFSGDSSTVSSSSNNGDKELWTDDIFDLVLLTLPPCDSRGRFSEETDLCAWSSSSDE